jgi:hypothetical protein
MVRRQSGTSTTDWDLVKVIQGLTDMQIAGFDNCCKQAIDRSDRKGDFTWLAARANLSCPERGCRRVTEE